MRRPCRRPDRWLSWAGAEDPVNSFPLRSSTWIQASENFPVSSQSQTTKNLKAPIGIICSFLFPEVKGEEAVTWIPFISWCQKFLYFKNQKFKLEFLTYRKMCGCLLIPDPQPAHRGMECDTQAVSRREWSWPRKSKTGQPIKRWQWVDFKREVVSHNPWPH